MYSGETRIYDALLTGLILFAGLMVFFIMSIVRYQRKRVMAYHELMEEEIGLLEKERARISNDLHDEVGVMLSALKLLLSGIKPGNEAERTVMEKVMGHLEEIMLKIRQLSYNMMPRILETKGLAFAVTDLLDIISFSNSIKTECFCILPKGLLDPAKEIHVFRIVQEIVNNILKHAKASSIHCELKEAGKNVILHISDNGIGFDKRRVMKLRQGVGLQNIVARASLLSAKLYITTQHNKGTDYLIEIPI